jgi:uncharacterized membrane protein YkoI
MMRSTKVMLAATAAVVLASAGVLAATSNDALNIPPAAISLAQAVTAAEQHVDGKAIRAEYERRGVRGQWGYDVEVIVGAKVFDVSVDPATGAIVSSQEDRTDRDDDHDRKD